MYVLEWRELAAELPFMAHWSEGHSLPESRVETNVIITTECCNVCCSHIMAGGEG